MKTTPFFVILNENNEVNTYGSGLRSINEEERTVFLTNEEYTEVVNKFGMYRISYQHQHLIFEPNLALIKKTSENIINRIMTDKIAAGFEYLNRQFGASLYDQQNITTLYNSRTFAEELFHKDKNDEIVVLTKDEVKGLYIAMTKFVQSQLKILWELKEQLTKKTTEDDVNALVASIN